MAKTVMLVDHEAIRDWVAARAGSPALQEATSAGNEPVLRIVFGQSAYEDEDQPERSEATGGIELIDWDEWFALFDKRHLALIVPEDQPGIRDEFHELVRRFDPGD
ncbi:hypothetical protein [Mesorhizobium sp. KR1-2]|uniref:hypothetical protein n=1 Tax=Mesorhizobium sp. KR1-2 TaxID=3156609 RepID=UPI0032B5FC1E